MTDATAGNISQDAAKVAPRGRRADRADARRRWPPAEGQPQPRAAPQKTARAGVDRAALLFILITFVAPIFDMLFRSVENQIVSETLPRTVIALEDWDAEGHSRRRHLRHARLRFHGGRRAAQSHAPRLAPELRDHGPQFRLPPVGPGHRRRGRDYADQFIALNEGMGGPATWVSLMASPTGSRRRPHGPPPATRTRPARLPPRPRHRRLLPETADAYRSFARTIQQEDEDSPLEEEPWNTVYLALYRDLAAGRIRVRYAGTRAGLLAEAAAAVDGFETVDAARRLRGHGRGLGRNARLGTIEAFSDPYTAGYFLAAVDLQLTPDGIEAQPEEQRIYMLLFQRTIFMSLVITISCVLLGYPIAYLLSNLPLRTSNLLLILVLLPFWTSLLVRTSAWKVLLQQEGVINDILVWIGWSPTTADWR
jgi:putative spermidine/putrescine transport system permease protein